MQVIPEPTKTMRELQDEVLTFAQQRGWLRSHNPRNLAEAVAVEAGELLQCFLWLSNDECMAQHLLGHMRQSIESELADVLIYSLNLANALRVDASQIVLTKIAQNRERFPTKPSPSGADEASASGDAIVLRGDLADSSRARN